MNFLDAKLKPCKTDPELHLVKFFKGGAAYVTNQIVMLSEPTAEPDGAYCSETGQAIDKKHPAPAEIWITAAKDQKSASVSIDVRDLKKALRFPGRVTLTIVNDRAIAITDDEGRGAIVAGRRV